MIKYLFSNINFSGKVSRKEDQRKLDAHIEDLFKKRIAYCEDLPPNIMSSHYGYPNEKVQSLQDWVSCLPNVDHI